MFPFYLFQYSVYNILCNAPLLFEKSAEQHSDKYAALTSSSSLLHEEEYNHFMTHFSSQNRRIFFYIDALPHLYGNTSVKILILNVNSDQNC